MPSTQGQVDYFLKLEGVEGETEDPKHPQEIAVLSFSFGCSQQGSGHMGTGLGAGKVSMQDFHFTMRLNKASPKLFLNCAVGEHIKKAILTCRKAGGDQVEYLVVTMTDCMVSSHQIGGSSSREEDVYPTDQCTLNFAKIEWQYTPQATEGGKPLSPVKAGYDVKKNIKV